MTYTRYFFIYCRSLTTRFLLLIFPTKISHISFRFCDIGEKPNLPHKYKSKYKLSEIANASKQINYSKSSGAFLFRNKSIPWQYRTIPFSRYLEILCYEHCLVLPAMCSERPSREGAILSTRCTVIDRGLRALRRQGRTRPLMNVRSYLATTTWVIFDLEWHNVKIKMVIKGNYNYQRNIPLFRCHQCPHAVQ